MQQLNATLYELGWFAACVVAVVAYEWVQRGRHADSDSPNLRGWQARVRVQWVLGASGRGVAHCARSYSGECEARHSADT